VNSAGKDGLLYGGGLKPLWVQAQGVGAVLSYSFVVTLILGYLLHKALGFRVPEDDEQVGIDLSEHAETAYEFGSGGGGGMLTGRVSSNSGSSASSRGKESVSV
jgi:ammonium transporter, Amt family